MNDDLEKKLVAACRDGDRSAYAGLVRAYSARIFAICLGILGQRQDAEDIAQQALLKGLTDIKQLRDSERFGPWIGRIAKNLCIDYIRRRKPKTNNLVERAVASDSGAKEYPELQKALAKLPQEHRLALMLYYFDGRSTRAIADILGISLGSVHSRISRARKHLRKSLETERGE